MIVLCPWLQCQHSCHFIWSFPDCVVRTVLLCVHMYCTLTLTIELHLKVVDIPTNNAATNKHIECSQIIIGRFDLIFFLFILSFSISCYFFLLFFFVIFFCYISLYYILLHFNLFYSIMSFFILLFFFI